MELLQLYYFMQVAKKENMSQVAKDLHIAQPSLSQTIKRLENELDTPLFDRQGKHLQLNEYGRIVERYGQHIFTALENIQSEIADLKGINHSTVSLKIQAASSLLPDLLKTFRQRHPDIHFMISQSTSNQPFPNESNLTLYAARQANTNDYLLLKERLVAILPIDHPLASKESIALQDLKEDLFISLDPQSNLYELLHYYCQQCHFEPNIHLYSDNPNTFRELLNLGMDVALIPEITWKQDIYPHLVIKPIHDIDCFRYIYLHWQKDQYQSSSAKALTAHIIEYFQQFTK
ncbi:LysR family transcriptional regulator [Beduini massiliensis]|uniref:LysR family transcriptional regulator n=1 Tax=Beduini massiliensis TaxID=1585974 RepID=UPI00059A7DF6|nr:LysR family transcriptional regulator [Beduini massiliensis]